MKGYKFNDEGEIIKSKITLVWGSPASGKTTYVKNNMKLGDMIIDLDYIKQSISMANKTSADDRLLNTAIKIRELLYDLVSDKDFECNDVWIVAGLPDKNERQNLIDRVKADEVVYIEATYQQCIDRAINDDERKDKDLQIKIIDKWHKRFYEE